MAKRLKTMTVLAAGLLILLAIPARAQTAQEMPDESQAFIQDLAEKTLAVLDDIRLTQEERDDEFHRLLAINLSRDVYCRLLRTVRAAIYLWTQELMAEGIAGEHNHYSPDERAKVAHLDDPEKFWRRAMDEVDSLPIPDVRVTGFFERVFGRAG